MCDQTRRDILGEPQPSTNDKKDDGISDRAFVVRRNFFNWISFGFGIFKHSGILIRKN